ncbi:hypothetical protein [Fimbriiglobus ruber]|uniref:SGNH/GDSL hydrolase family protein n=1 Tax=Fimbriiglobus ruber TaxID=1908690 RepID=A0A225D434_9BACT|nr:hypothetical protein [Fimbriiglobus ruber]OWK36361.1 hypothetical protein FRUB_08924 [Fimbriiglobus ruber]
MTDAATTPRNARRFLPPLLLLLALLLIDGALVSFRDTWERYSPDDYAERVRGCQQRPRDFVLVGGSPVSEGLNPAVVAGVTWRGQVLSDGYAVGLPGGTAADVFYAVRHACPTLPKVIVYGIAASDLNDSRLEPHGPYSLMTWGDWSEWVGGHPESAEWVTRHFVQGRLSRCWAAYRYRYGIRTWAAAELDARFPGSCPEAAKEARTNRNYSDALRGGNGYAPAEWFVGFQYDDRKRAGWEAPPFEFLDKYRTGNHLKYLPRLAEWCAERGTTLILLDMPVTEDLETRYPAVLAEYHRRLDELEAERKIVVWRASRQAVGLDDTQFADIIHLNGSGAARLSGWLRARLAGDGK